MGAGGQAWSWALSSGASRERTGASAAGAPLSAYRRTCTTWPIQMETIRHRSMGSTPRVAASSSWPPPIVTCCAGRARVPVGRWNSRRRGGGGGAGIGSSQLAAPRWPAAFQWGLCSRAGAVQADERSGRASWGRGGAGLDGGVHISACTLAQCV